MSRQSDQDALFRLLKSRHPRDERIHQLYEQGADSCRIGEYVRRWWSWAKAGLGPTADLTAVPQSVPFTPPDADAASAGPMQAGSRWR